MASSRIGSPKDPLNICEMQITHDVTEYFSPGQKKSMEQTLEITTRHTNNLFKLIVHKESGILIPEEHAKTDKAFQKFNELCHRLISLNVGHTWAQGNKANNLLTIYVLTKAEKVPEVFSLLQPAKQFAVYDPTQKNKSNFQELYSAFLSMLTQYKEVYTQTQSIITSIKLNSPQMLLQKISAIQAEFDVLPVPGTTITKKLENHYMLLRVQLELAKKVLEESNNVYNVTLDSLKLHKMLIKDYVQKAAQVRNFDKPKSSTVATSSTLMHATFPVLPKQSALDFKAAPLASGNASHTISMATNPSALHNKPLSGINNVNKVAAPAPSSPTSLPILANYSPR